MCEETDRQPATLPEQLTLWEGPDAYFVGWEDQDDDWIARFEKGEGFPAHDWAVRMVELYNYGNHQPQDPIGRPGRYAP